MDGNGSAAEPWPVCPGCGQRHPPHDVAWKVARGDTEIAGTRLEVEAGTVTLELDLRQHTLLAVATTILHREAKQHGDKAMMARVEEMTELLIESLDRVENPGA